MCILKYCIMVKGPAYGNQSAISALQFIYTLLKRGHHLKSIFFYQDGVYNANYLNTPSSDELNLIIEWKKLSQKYKIKLNVCISSAFRRGIIDSKNSVLYNYNNNNLDMSFKLSSLNTLMKEIIYCDRFLQF